MFMGFCVFMRVCLCVPKGVMGIYECLCMLWVSGCLWVFMGFWVLIGFWVLMSVYGYLWAFMGFSGFLRVSMGTYRYGFMDFMSVYGILWVLYLNIEKIAYFPIQESQKTSKITHVL